MLIKPQLLEFSNFQSNEKNGEMWWTDNEKNIKYWKASAK